MKTLVTILFFTIQTACSAVSIADDERKPFLVIGKVTIPQPDSGSQVVRVVSAGIVSNPTVSSVGIGRHEVVTFPAKCGAVLLDPEIEVVERIQEILPDLSKDCIHQRNEK